MQLPELPKTLRDFAEDELAKCTKFPFYDYLNYVINGGYAHPIVKAKNVEKLIEVLKQERFIFIEGPKESGKTIFMCYIVSNGCC